jgi:CheY-like chemotaxis protein
MNEKPSSRGEIFVVDDDPAVRETLSIVLSAGGYEVIASQTALRCCRRNAPPHASC